MKKSLQSQSKYCIWLSINEMEQLLQSKTLIIEGNNHHYITSVIRLQHNASIECIAENGIIARSRIVETKRSSSRISLESHYEVMRAPFRIILALGFSKQIRRSFILEKCVELGIHALWLWQGDHSQGEGTIKDSWYEILYSSATQCRNPYIPKIAYFGSLARVVEEAHKEEARSMTFYEDRGQTNPTTLHDWDALKQPLVLIVGCEGGFSQKEVSFLQEENIPKHSLGSRILRYETAALVACSMAVMFNDVKGVDITRHS